MSDKYKKILDDLYAVNSERCEAEERHQMFLNSLQVKVRAIQMRCKHGHKIQYWNEHGYHEDCGVCGRSLSFYARSSAACPAPQERR